MSEDKIHSEKSHRSANLAPEAESTAAGLSSAPPPFQLKATSLAGLANLQAEPAGPNAAPVQRVRLRDFNDADPDHDPSHVSDADIQQTDEYKSLMNPALVWQTSDHVTAPEALLTCRLILRAMREGTTVNWERNARQYLNQARSQLGTLTQAEGMENTLDWNNQAPGLTNTAFGRWLLSGGPEPTGASAEMNCWELVMFSAYRGGFTTEARLRSLYTTFAANLGSMSVPAAVAAFETAIRRGSEYVYDRSDPDSPRPLPGDLVIFNNLGAHVAVAVGQNGAGEIEIMSLWTQNSQRVFRTTVEHMLDNEGAGSPVRFFSPTW